MARVTHVKKAAKPHKCQRCGRDIAKGDPYKHISPRTHRAARGRKLVRCAECPDWQVWEYSNSLSARIQQIQYEGAKMIEAAEDNLEDVPGELASAIRDLAEEKRESATNIEYGFGHATSQSDELNQTADDLDGWADEIEDLDLDDRPELEEHTRPCDECDGSGYADATAADSQACEVCHGDGEVPDEDGFESALSEWFEGKKSELEGLLESSPV